MIQILIQITIKIFAMITRILISIGLFLALLQVMSGQHLASTYIRHHKPYFDAIVDVKRGKCDEAQVHLTEHSSQLKGFEKAHYEKKANVLMSGCIQESKLSPRPIVEGHTLTTYKLRMPRKKMVKQMSKEDIEVTESSSAKSKNNDLKSVESINKIMSYGIKFATRTESDFSFISLQHLGPIIAVPNNGQYDYYISSLKNNAASHQKAQILADQGYTDVAIFQLQEGNPVKEIKKFTNQVIEETKQKDEVKKTPIKAITQNFECAIIIHSLKDTAKISKVKSKIDAAGYIVFEEKVGESYRIGIASKCDEVALSKLLSKVKSQFNSNAWIRR